MTEAERLQNELDAAVEHAEVLIRQRNEARELNRRLLDAISLDRANAQGIKEWMYEEHGLLSASEILGVLTAVRWKAGL